MRDSVDGRVIDQIRRGEGGIINSQTEVGGWPLLEQGTAPLDSDSDGMPDAWELTHTLDPRNPANAAQDTDGDGFTDIEEFLNNTDPQISERWIEPPTESASEGETFVGSTTVTLASTEPEAKIRYTLDDSLPDESSTLYAGPLELSRSATLRTRAFVGTGQSHVHNVEFQRLESQSAVLEPAIAEGLRFDYYEQESWSGFPDFSTLRPTESGVVPNISLSPRKREMGFGLQLTGLLWHPGTESIAFIFGVPRAGSSTSTTHSSWRTRAVAANTSERLPSNRDCIL